MISVIIIGYNNYFYLKNCLESLISQTASIEQIIYVDNNSIDNSVEFIETYYPQVKIIKSYVNLGYAKAANLGIDFSKGNFVLIMNPDMILNPDYIHNSLVSLKKNPKAAGVMGKIYKYDFSLNKKTKIIDTIGLVVLRGRQFLDNGAAIQDIGQFEKPMEIFGITGNCALFRKVALNDSKIYEEYFDEDFFMYKEDVDLCWRLRLLGWTFIYTPNAIAYHNRGTGVLSRVTLKGSITGRKQLDKIQKYYSLKNQQLMLLKNELSATFFRDFLSIASREIAIILWVFLFETIRFEVFFELFKQIPLILNKRKIIMKRKRVSSNEIMPWLRGRGLIRK